MGDRIDIATEILVMAARNYILAHKFAGDAARDASSARVRDTIGELNKLLSGAAGDSGTGTRPLSWIQPLELQTATTKDRVPRRSPKGETEVALFEREKSLLQMRREGHTFQSCADTLGFHDASHASKAFHAALKRIPADEVDMIRAEAAERIQFLYAQAMRNVLDPPFMHSAIGKPIPHPTRPGEFLVNESVRNAAIEACRKLTKEHLSVMGVSLGARTPDESAEIEEMLSWVEGLVKENREMRARLSVYEQPDIEVVDAELIP